MEGCLEMKNHKIMELCGEILDRRYEEAIKTLEQEISIMEGRGQIHSVHNFKHLIKVIKIHEEGMNQGWVTAVCDRD
jgi:hypothetical protein